MSLSAREQKVLAQIGYELADSDPDLASFLFRFTWLAADEALPAREQVCTGWRPFIRLRPRSRPRCETGTRAAIRRPRQRFPRWRLVWPLLWLTTSVALIGVALAVGHGASQYAGHEVCPGLVPSCTGVAPVSALYAHRPAAGHGQ